MTQYCFPVKKNRRKSALPKYEPPYAKRQMMKGYSHPNSPHPSQLTPDHTFDGGLGSKMSLTGIGAGGGGPPGSAGSQMMAGIPGFGPPGTPGYRPME